MAAWQYDVYLVPSENVAATGLKPGRRLSREQCDELQTWKLSSRNADLESLITGILPRAVDMQPGWLVFGDETGHRIDVLQTPEGIEELRARVDVRDTDPGFVVNLCELAREIDCALLSAECVLLNADPEALWVEVTVSPAASFIEDPEAFLARLRASRDRKRN
jgi:hypothetical protein